MGGRQARVRYKIALEKGAKRSLEKRIDSDIVKDILQRIDSLEHDPHIGKALKGTMKGKYRLIVRRTYRVVYRIDEQQKLVVVEKVAHRSKVYK